MPPNLATVVCVPHVPTDRSSNNYYYSQPTITSLTTTYLFHSIKHNPLVSFTLLTHTPSNTAYTYPYFFPCTGQAPRGPHALHNNIMAPRAPTLFSIMSSTSYPPVPSIDELEQLQQALKAQQVAAASRLATMAPAPEPERKLKKEAKRKDRDQTDERERAALAANQRAGAALEVVERRRVDTDVKVKNERGESM